MGIPESGVTKIAIETSQGGRSGVVCALVDAHVVRLLVWINTARANPFPHGVCIWRSIMLIGLRPALRCILNGSLGCSATQKQAVLLGVTWSSIQFDIMCQLPQVAASFHHP